MGKSVQTNLLSTKIGKTIVFFLLNGKEIKGTLRGFEQYTITIENEKGFLETYYKHVISKICWGKAQFLNKIIGAKKQEEKPEEEK